MAARITLGTSIAPFHDSSLWSASAGTTATVYAPRTSLSGSAVTSFSHSAYAYLTYTSATDIDMSAADVLSFEFYCDISGSYLGPVTMRFVFYDVAGNYWQLTLPLNALRSGWNSFVVNKPSVVSSYWAKSAGTANWATIRSIVCTATPPTGQVHRTYYSSIRLGYTSTAYFCLSSDDGYKSDITNVMPILRDHGLKQTHYVNAPSTGVLMSRADWDTLYGMGHGISNHGTHTRLTTVTGAAMIAAIEPTMNSLLGYGYAKSARHFAYPFGEYNAEALAALVANHYTARMTSSPFCQGHFRPNGYAEYLLGAYGISSPVPTLAAIQPHLQLAIDTDAYFHLYWHELTSAGDLANLAAIAEWLADQVAAGTCRVGPVHEYYDWLIGQPTADAVLKDTVFGVDDQNTGTLVPVKKYLCVTGA